MTAKCNLLELLMLSTLTLVLFTSCGVPPSTKDKIEIKHKPGTDFSKLPPRYPLIDFSKDNAVYEEAVLKKYNLSLEYILKKNKMNLETFKKLEPYIVPPITKLIGRGFDLQIPQIPGNQGMAKLGFLDVTAAPFYADPSGKYDSTKAIQAAVNFARDHQLVTFFPLGTYKVSDTIHAVQGYYMRQNGRLQSAANHPNVIVGSAKASDKRPVILLAPGSEGFNTPEKRKIVVHIYNRSKKKMNPEMHQPNISYNQIFKGIDITVGKGNRGAVGIRMQAAEGSAIEDVTLNMGDGLLGMQSAAGSGGSHHNITVIGGRFGADTHGMKPEFALNRTGTQPTPTFTHFTLINQTETALVNKSRGPLICVGLKIVTQTRGPVITITDPSDYGIFNSSIALIDSIIEFENPGSNKVIDTKRSFYFNNVFIKNAETIYKGIKGETNGWINFKHLAVTVNPVDYKNYSFQEYPYINGKKQTEPYVVLSKKMGPPADLLSKHIWGKNFPTHESTNIANVKNAPYNAKGDTLADDTAALQKAIDENDIVFLPKGYYKISDTIKLKPNTKLIGAAKHLSIIMTNEPEGKFLDTENIRPMVETANDKNAETILAFVGIFVMRGQKPKDFPSDYQTHYALKWQAGRKSIMRDCYIKYEQLNGFPKQKSDDYVYPVSLKYKNPLILITGNGGGKWYNFFIHGQLGCHKDFRYIAAKDTHEPLSFYHLHAQHCNADAQLGFQGSQNIDVFGIKTEHHTRTMTVDDCNNIRLFGHGGNAKAKPKSAHYLINNTPNFLITNFGDQPSLKPTTITVKSWWATWYNWNIKEYAPYIYTDKNGKSITMPSLERPIIFLMESNK